MSAVSGLERFRKGETLAEPKVITLEMPTTYKFDGRLLMVDQTVAKTGWSYMAFVGTPKPIEFGRGMIPASGLLSGHEATLTASTLLFQVWLTFLETRPVDAVVHEIPPVGGAGMARPESSLLAANALRNACSVHGIPVFMLGAQKAKKRWTGNGNATKAQVKASLESYWPALALSKPWNQDISDAVALGLTWAEINPVPARESR